MWMKRHIDRLGNPTPTIGDDLPYYSCFYENVPPQYKIRNLIIPAFSWDRWPKTYAMIDNLIDAADEEFTGWEIKGKTFEDFGKKIKHYFRLKADGLERHIDKLEELDVVLSSKTRMTIGPGKTVLTTEKHDDTTNTRTFIGNKDTTKGTDSITGKPSNNVDITVTNSGPITQTTEGGRIGINPKADPSYRPDSKGTTKTEDESKVVTTNKTNSVLDHTTTHDITVEHSGTIEDKVHIDNKDTDTTTTDERINETETITPGVAIAEIAKIPGIQSPEEYFIEMLKPCFTLYRWYNW